MRITVITKETLENGLPYLFVTIFWDILQAHWKIVAFL